MKKKSHGRTSFIINITYIKNPSENNIIIYCIFPFSDITENNLMGAAEWTGYSGTTPSYSPFSSLQSTPSSYNYDNSSITEHHTNFHIPTGKINFFTSSFPFCFESNKKLPNGPPWLLQHVRRKTLF